MEGRVGKNGAEGLDLRRRDNSHNSVSSMTSSQRRVSYFILAKSPRNVKESSGSLTGGSPIGKSHSVDH